MDKKDYISSSSFMERLGHWLLAGSSVILLLTGIGFLFSSLQWSRILFGGRAGAFFIHRLAGIFFSTSLFISFLVWFKDCLPDNEDWKWLRGGRYYKKMATLPVGGRFNFLQKIFFWGVILFGLLASLTGWSLWTLYPLSKEFLGWCYALHTLSASFFIINSIIHIYVRVLINPDSLSGITVGRINRSWAQLYRSKWLEKIEKQREDY